MKLRRLSPAPAGAMVLCLALCLVFGLAGCTHEPASAPLALRLRQPVTLLGEVHDNAAQHALRLQALQAWLATGARPALVMEQFDRDRQGAIDRLRQQQPPPDADALIKAAGAPGWDWAFYKPYIELALNNNLPIVAANVSREEARQIMRQGLQASGFDAAVPPEILQALSEGIRESHCGMLDEPTSRRMALAQVARDQSMARSIEGQAARGVVLLAGNGHVRIDIGAPRWLSPATRALSESIGVLEMGMDDGGHYDRSVRTAVQERGDPCEGMKR
jgi:uncharacterized iron-regulated protein